MQQWFDPRKSIRIIFHSEEAVDEGVHGRNTFAFYARVSERSLEPSLTDYRRKLRALRAMRSGN